MNLLELKELVEHMEQHATSVLFYIDPYPKPPPQSNINLYPYIRFILLKEYHVITTLSNLKNPIRVDNNTYIRILSELLDKPKWASHIHIIILKYQVILIRLWHDLCMTKSTLNTNNYHLLLCYHSYLRLYINKILFDN